MSMGMDPEREKYPDVEDWQHEVIEQWGDQLVNTGGNDPRDLLQRLHDEERLAATNVWVFTLATAVLSQVALLAKLKHRIEFAPGDLVEKIGTDLDDREVVSVGRDFLYLDLGQLNGTKVPRDNYRVTVPGDGRL